MSAFFYITACLMATVAGWAGWIAGVHMMLHNISDFAVLGLRGQRLAWFLAGWLATMVGLFLCLMGPTLAYYRMLGHIIPLSAWIT